MKRAVVLLSGGLDSMVCAGLAREQGFAVLALTVDYGQRHRIEVEAARTIAASLAERHIILPIDLTAFGGSALTADIDVPKDGIETGIPVTYVPARNTVFLSLRWRGPRRPAHAICSLGSMPSTIRVIPTADPSSSARSRPWPTSRPRPGSRAEGSGSTRRCNS